MQGFKKSVNEHTFYKNTEENGKVLLVCIYVDDIVCLSSLTDLITKFKFEMKEFDMSDLGMLSYFLGIEVLQDEKGVFLTQRKYTLDLLRRFNMINCKASPTPMCINERFQCDDE